ncbi:helix-turn-helix domain-containing protein [Apilactobacillus apisilvae]|uniref:Helix-turn-helix domain-containing protein n=1 Tax=Apilactobacillus apisilvae TaxID=2923364 RepID=A0ABY4PHS8_9LACO|nr:helix-turn-helix transcriptional regulator [Apilactobacillus apisilvae]UQS85162.1 helix-turn-helix domain-containing protein [Apilactobacillus apisilvae]
MNTNGELIKQARERLGINQTQLAKMINRTQTTISNIENDNHKTDLDTFLLISDKLNISIDKFVDNDFSLSSCKIYKVKDYILNGNLFAAEKCLSGMKEYNIDENLIRSKFNFYKGYIKLRKYNNYTEAILLMQNAYMSLKTSDDCEHYIWVCSYLSNTFYKLKKYDEAYYFCNKSLNFIKHNEVINHSSDIIKDSYNVLHYVLCQTNRYEEAKYISGLVGYRELAFTSTFEILLRENHDDEKFHQLIKDIMNSGISLPISFKKITKEHNLL